VVGALVIVVRAQKHPYERTECFHGARFSFPWLRHREGAPAAGIDVPGKRLRAIPNSPGEVFGPGGRRKKTNRLGFPKFKISTASCHRGRILGTIRKETVAGGEGADSFGKRNRVDTRKRGVLGSQCFSSQTFPFFSFHFRRTGIKRRMVKEEKKQGVLGRGGVRPWVGGKDRYAGCFGGEGGIHSVRSYPLR